MKNNRFLLLLVLLMVVFIPFHVHAEELYSKVEIEIDDPQENQLPDTTANVILSNSNEEKQLEDVEIIWFQEDGTQMKETDVFLNNEKYYFKFNESLTSSGFTEDLKMYVNGYEYAEGNLFCINGLKSFNVVTDLIIGEAFPTVATIILKTSDTTVEEEVEIAAWYVIDEENNQLIKIETDDVVESGKKYWLEADGDVSTLSVAAQELIYKDDLRTVFLFNGSEEEYYVGRELYSIIFDANGGVFKDGTTTIKINDIINFDYESFEKPTRDGYKFIGFYTEKTGGTSYYDLMNSEAGIEEDTILYARWEVEEENPKTFDEIGTSIFMGTISLIGLIGATIYLKKRNKVRA